MANKIESVEDLEIWKQSTELCIDIYKIFKECKDYSLKDQIQRASVSIPSNISEGFERGSNKEFIHFLYYAKGSCAELRTQIYIASKVGLIEENNAKEIINKTNEISRKIFNLIKVRKEKF